MSVSRFVRLNTGALMPTIGFGTYLASENVLQKSVDVALHSGYRHIDTAYSYHNDEDIGQVVADNIRAGKLKRKDLFITTKIPPVNLALGAMRPCVEETLDKLKMTYIDLLLIHAPFPRKNVQSIESDGKVESAISYYNLCEIWSVFETFFKERVVKAIGVSNFSIRQLEKISQKALVKPANLQAECHGYLQQKELRAYCKAKDIVMTGYSPLGAPGLANTEEHKDNPVLLHEPIIVDLAKQLHKTPSQILLRYLLQLDISPLPKSTTPERIFENAQVYDFDIPPEAMERLSKLDCNLKFFQFKSYANHPEYPAQGEAF